MKLPKGTEAIVDMTKLTDYCLNPDHEEGKHKARVFRSALGITKLNLELLRVGLLRAAATEDAMLVSETKYGNLYMLDFVLTTGMGSASIRSGWIIRTGESVPRLTTCFVNRRLN